MVPYPNSNDISSAVDSRLHPLCHGHVLKLEDFLITNRDEYLRHSSSMNYTPEQRKYNNRLTERLLDLAAKHNYVFDDNDFNFVAVRDRIRCYYKSYVQSHKKRGAESSENKAVSESRSVLKKGRMSPSAKIEKVQSSTRASKQHVKEEHGNQCEVV